MRLISRLDALEKQKRLQADSAPSPEIADQLAAGARIGIVWTASDFRVDPRQAAPGEHVAVDLVIERDQSENREQTGKLRTRERFTDDPDDLGLVYDLAGDRIGRVVAAPAGYLRWELDSPPGDLAASG